MKFINNNIYEISSSNNLHPQTNTIKLSSYFYKLRTRPISLVFESLLNLIRLIILKNSSPFKYFSSFSIAIIVYLSLFSFNSFVCNCFNFETKKVVVHRPPFLENTDFGFTVAGYKVENDSWILVGAPQTPRERNHGQLVSSKEGAVYRCRINTPNSCYMLPFDKKDWTAVRDNLGFFYSENKTGQLLGATLSVSGDVIMACAPNYRYVTRIPRQKNEFRYEPTGTCFTLKDKMRKFEEHSPCRNSMWGHHRQGYCQAGFSAAISKNDSALFISGPGAWYWQGMIFSINLYNKDIKSRYPDKSGEGNTDDSYRGYSMDVGHFDNDNNEDLVVSSPRGLNCKGYIEIFSYDLRVLHRIEGYQIGAYFGGSILAVDLNNDQFTDIIVGSPMFKKDTENYDLGRIDVYLRDTSKSITEFHFKKITLNGFKSKSRFGNSLTKLGDVNDDGYNDIAVGAPYDGEDGNGIVYIFHGGPDGLQSTPHQIIKGSDYNIKTFGYSLSGGLDLDGNKYPDLIIGAYKSDAVVFIRSKPVIKTSITMQTNPKLIDFETRDYCDKNKTRICMDLEFCIQYSGKAVPSTIRMLMSMELDVNKYQNKSLIRAMFSETKTHQYYLNFTFRHDHRKCFKQVIFVKKAIRDKLTPITCRLNLTLPKYDTDWELMPIFNSSEESSKTHEIRFLRNCGTDDVCTPNLIVSASSPSKRYVFGSRNNIDLNIQIENAKEDAFEAQCHITLPYGVDYVKAFAHQTFLPCSQNKANNETRIVCDIGNPMLGGSLKSFTIRVAPLHILLDQESLKFNITVTSSNKEEKNTTTDNEDFVYVILDAIPSITLIGKQYEEQVIYETKFNDANVDMIKNESEIGPEIIHEYKVMNKGPSQFLLSELLISWQKLISINYKNKDFLYLVERPYLEGPIQCNYENIFINPLNLSKIEGDKLKNPDKYYFKESKNEAERIKRSFEDSNGYFLNYLPNDLYLNPYREKNKIVLRENIECISGMVKQTNLDLEREKLLDMQLGNIKNKNTKINYLGMMKMPSYDFYCSSIHCKVGPLGADESALIRLRFRLWSRSLALNPDIYRIKTYGMAAVTEIPYTKANLNYDQFQSSVQIETIAHPKERKQFDKRIVIFSIITGIILLFLLVLILWCCGFFKRFEPQQEIQKKLSELATSDEEISSSNDVIDVSKECSKAILNREHIILLSPKLTFNLKQEKLEVDQQNMYLDNNNVSNQMYLNMASYDDKNVSLSSTSSTSSATSSSSLHFNNKKSNNKNLMYSTSSPKHHNTKHKKRNSPSVKTSSTRMTNNSSGTHGSANQDNDIYGFGSYSNQLSTFQNTNKNLYSNVNMTNNTNILDSSNFEENPDIGDNNIDSILNSKKLRRKFNEANRLTGSPLTLSTRNNPNSIIMDNSNNLMLTHTNTMPKSIKSFNIQGNVSSPNANTSMNDAFTTKLPPVPRRNSKNHLISLHNSNINLSSSNTVVHYNGSTNNLTQNFTKPSFTTLINNNNNNQFVNNNNNSNKLETNVNSSSNTALSITYSSNENSNNKLLNCANSNPGVSNSSNSGGLTSMKKINNQNTNFYHKL